MSLSSATGFLYELAPAIEPGPQVYEVSPQEGKVSNPFYFEDTQVVLQASLDITSYPYIH